MVVDRLEHNLLLVGQRHGRGARAPPGDMPRHGRMLLIPHALPELAEWLAYVALQDLLRQQRLIRNLEE
jgi:hypothetical protein